jgi:hypothetical protein
VPCRKSDGGIATLGLNDLSTLLPLDVQLAAPADLIPRGLYDRIRVDELGMPFIIDVFDELQVVAVRLDLCDRVTPGPCPRGDGRLRLVLQPNEHGMVRDTAFHAFYPVPAAELPTVLDMLEAASEHVSAPLGVRPLSPARTQALTQLLQRYCTPDRLVRLTFFSQADFFAQVRWMLRGVELHDGGFADIAIPQATDGGVQHVFLADRGYEATMLADVPAGFATVISNAQFSAASQTDRDRAVSALAEIDNPLARSLDTLQCLSCHVSTPLSGMRTGTASGTYTSPYDLSIDGGGSRTNELSLRAFGWRLDQPMISHRVANETAQVLSELAACPVE